MPHLDTKTRYSATSIIQTLFIQNLDYPELANTLARMRRGRGRWSVWCKLSNELDSSTDLSWPKLTDKCTYMYMNTADNDHAIIL